MQLRFLNSSSKVLKMRGILVKKFGGTDEMVLSNSLPMPQYNENQVLVKVNCSGVNPVDTYIRSGNYGMLPSLPFTPGKDGAGTIEDIGKNVITFKKGDRVFCTAKMAQTGTLSEYVSVDIWNVFPLAPHMSFEEGSAIPVPYFTAHRALFYKGNAKTGNTVLVHGASGAVGLAAVQVAKANGMTVVGTAGTEEGLALVRKIGADAVYNHRDKNYVQQIQVDFPEKFDVILEMLANVNLQTDMTLMRSRATTVVIGCRGDTKISPRLLMLPESSITGCSLFSSTPEEWKVITDAILDGIKDGWVKPVVGKVYSLDQAGQAHYDIINNTGTIGKLVVKIEDED